MVVIDERCGVKRTWEYDGEWDDDPYTLDGQSSRWRISNRGLGLSPVDEGKWFEMGQLLYGVTPVRPSQTMVHRDGGSPRRLLKRRSA